MIKSYIKKDSTDCIGDCSVCPYKEEGTLYAPCNELNEFYGKQEEEKLDDFFLFLEENQEIPSFLKCRNLGFLAELKV